MLCDSSHFISQVFQFSILHRPVKRHSIERIEENARARTNVFIIGSEPESREARYVGTNFMPTSTLTKSMHR